LGGREGGGMANNISTPTRITRESKTLIDIICSNRSEVIFCLQVDGSLTRGAYKR